MILKDGRSGWKVSVMKYESDNSFTAVGVASGNGEETVRDALMENKLPGRNPHPCGKAEFNALYEA